MGIMRECEAGGLNVKTAYYVVADLYVPFYRRWDLQPFKSDPGMR